MMSNSHAVWLEITINKSDSFAFYLLLYYANKFMDRFFRKSLD